MKRLKDQTHEVVTITISQVREVYKNGATTKYKHKQFMVDVNQGHGRRTMFSSVHPCQMWAHIIQEAYVLD